MLIDHHPNESEIQLKNNVKNVLDLQKEKFSKKNVEALLLNKLAPKEVSNITSTPLRTLRKRRQLIKTLGPKPVKKKLAELSSDFLVSLFIR